MDVDVGRVAGQCLGVRRVPAMGPKSYGWRKRWSLSAPRDRVDGDVTARTSCGRESFLIYIGIRENDFETVFHPLQNVLPNAGFGDERYPGIKDQGG
ncbi:hypothetical protein HPP92_008390 [Vanilla planifolia]|uniref:Uncharacterized protein n=1 Tax=Vanilla planifolia TaxID=51239 RepID=A0A835V768_VANPL|nr:hypothetical protein HPP92_008580 [Vanilla planifolia]KAG0486295.1 hypothetical protein HPP92_008390 [Vanilla planifolia]